VNSSDFEFVADLMRKRAGIVLGAEKTYLIDSRLAPLARKEGLPSIDDLIQVVRGRRDERLISQVVDVMTTNETFFFRDRTPFAHLRETIFPMLAQARRGSRIRIWCAGCASGQEPYSIAMMLDQNPELTGGVPVEIVATDISERCLERARSGVYTQFEIQRGLPIQMLMRYFTQQDDNWRIAEKLRGAVAFRKHNLLESAEALGKFDAIFLRNVLIYFDGPTRAATLNRVSDVLHPGGFLLLGASETPVGSTMAFEPAGDRRALYRLAQRATQAA
jgi:chemotaxis protein methyltransferase CheR